MTSVPLLDIPLDPKIVYNFHCYEPFAFTHQGAYWVDQMPKDFRIGYPRRWEEYLNAAEKMGLAQNLAGTIPPEETGLVGKDFFLKIFAPALEKARKDQVPLYCGEYGVIDLADNADTIRWLKDIHQAMDEYGIGRALWNYKEKDFGFSGEKFAGIREDFIRIL